MVGAVGHEGGCMQQPNDGTHYHSEQGGLARYFVEHREVGWLALVTVLIWGAISYFLLPQQEDPSLPRRIARVVCIWPGATAQKIEELVTRPVEKKIAELETMEEMSSESRENFTVITLGQHPDRPAKIEQEWDKLRAKLGELKLPEGASAPDLQTDFGDIVTLLLAVTGAPSTDDHTLREAADRLEDELKQVPNVGGTRQIGAVGETVQLRLSPEALRRHGLSLFRVAELLKQRNQIIPSGTFRTEAQNLPVQLSAEFRDEKEIGEMLIGQGAEGLPLRLRDVLEVRRGSEDPLPLTTDFLQRGQGGLERTRAVLLSVEMKSGQVIGEFGRAVAATVERVRPQLPSGIRVEKVSDQPESVERRIGQFNRCFGEAVLVVIAVSLLLMEWRAALVVALAIPLTIAMTLGGMQLAGIPLHQISIAALIIALGMLVDDPVVAADGINRELAAGRPREVAAWLGPFRLRRAILFATIINICAFLPLVLLPGDKKDFIYSLPVVVTISLIASRIVSMTFIPLFGYYVLRGQAGIDQGRGLLRGLSPIYRGVLGPALRWPWLAALLAYGLLSASLLLAPKLGRQFFPPAERNQLLIDLRLPESASQEATRKVCDRAVQALQGYPEVQTGAVFLSGSAPRFYYNVTPKAPSDHLAQILINTRRAEEVPDLVARLRKDLDAAIPEARCVVKQLEQGPPVDTPIQIRLTGESTETLKKLGREVEAALNEASGYKVHDDLGERVPSLEISVDPERAGALGIATPAVGLAVRAAFAEVQVTELRDGRHAVPVVLRLREEERRDLEKIRALPVDSLKGGLVPLSEFARVEEKQAFAVIPHFGQQRSVTVKAYAPVGRLPADVLSAAKAAIDRIALPAGYRLEYAGEAKELRQSQAEMGRVMAISLALITLAMVIQFNSLVKSVVVMLTVPLGLIGALIGLTLFHAPVGFMAMLALVSLAGVIVSHIIVLSDFIEEARADGMELREALIQAGLVRMRPVLVTVVATAGGLIPLALTGGELWHPLTAVHIFGLLAATGLTLFVLPVLYYLFAARLRWIR